MELEFAAYREFVPTGSYVIVENTMFNGHPVWPGHGPARGRPCGGSSPCTPTSSIDPTMASATG